MENHSPTTDPKSISNIGFRDVTCRRSSIGCKLSPHASKRRLEKDHMCGLNDRLASYIERAQRLNAENSRLSFAIEKTEQFADLCQPVSNDEESQTIRDIFLQELNNARCLIEETKAEKSALELELDEYKSQLPALNKKCIKLEQRLDHTTKDILDTNISVKKLESEIAITNEHSKLLRSEYDELLRNNEYIQEKLNKMLNSCQVEVSLCEDYTSQIDPLVEELSSQRQQFDLTHDNLNRSATSLSASRFQERLDAEYAEKLHASLNEMRLKLDEEINRNRQEIAALFDSKFTKVMNENTQSRDLHKKSLEDLKEASDLLTAYTSSVEENEIKLLQAEKQMETLLRKLSVVNSCHSRQLKEKDDIIERLNSEIGRLKEMHNNLLDNKIYLSNEIDSYRTILEIEEERLYSSPTFSNRQFKKAKRRLFDGELALDIKETSVDNLSVKIAIENDDQCIRIFNLSDEVLPIAHHYIKCTCNGTELSYRFPKKAVVVQPKESVGVYSKGSKVANENKDYLMVKQKWPIGDQFRVAFCNSDEKVISSLEKNRMPSITIPDRHNQMANENGTALAQENASQNGASVAKIIPSCTLM